MEGGRERATESERKRVCVRVGARARERKSVCVCVGERVSEREKGT